MTSKRDVRCKYTVLTRAEAAQGHSHSGDSSCCCHLSRVWLCNPINCSTPGFFHYHPVCSDPHPFSQWCYPTLSSCHPLLLLPSTFPAASLFHKLAFHIRWPKCSVLPMNIQGWFPLGMTRLISLQSKGLFKSPPQFNCQGKLEPV